MPASNSCIFTPALQRELVLTRGTDGNYIASVTQRDILAVPLRIAGTIHSSLFEAAAKAGMPQAVLNDAIHAFSYDVDFQREVQPGDSFEVLFDQLVDEKTGKIVGTGDIAYASLTLSGKLDALYRYVSPNGDVGFFNADGTNVKKALLRTPSMARGLARASACGITRSSASRACIKASTSPCLPARRSWPRAMASSLRPGWAGGYGNLSCCATTAPIRPPMAI